MKKLIVTLIASSVALSSISYACGGHKHRHVDTTKSAATQQK